MKCFFSRKQQKYLRDNAVILTICFIVIAFIVNLFVPHLYWNDLGKCGTFGDQFGAINALFSGIAFAGLIYTIMLQRSDLRNQRKELFLQRQEMRRNRGEMITQNKTLALQRFENTFFSMMELQQQIVNNLEITITTQGFIFGGKKGFELLPEKKDITYRGREVFEKLYSGNSSKSSNFETEIQDSGLDGYLSSDARSMLDLYFRHFYTILNFIDKSKAFIGEIEEEQESKYQYAKILRATLSRYELVLLYYNGLSPVGNEKLKPLLERYSMLKNLNEDFLTLSHDALLSIGEKDENNIKAYLGLKNITANDYYFFLTENSDPKKYSLHAFYHGDKELRRGKEQLAIFNKVIAEYHAEDASKSTN